MSVISLSLAKKACTVDYDDQDEFIQILIDGAEEFVERTTGTYLSAAAQTDDLQGGGHGLWPLRAPVNSVTSVTDIESGSEESSDDYQVKKNGIFRYSGSRWDAGPVCRWRVVYNGGYETVPAGLKVIILGLIVRAYHGRGGKTDSSAAGYDVGWESLMDSDMIRKLEAYRVARSVFG